MLPLKLFIILIILNLSNSIFPSDKGESHTSIFDNSPQFFFGNYNKENKLFWMEDSGIVRLDIKSR